MTAIKNSKLHGLITEYKELYQKISLDMDMKAFIDHQKRIEKLSREIINISQNKGGIQW
jgi:hypothetical protein